MCRCLVAISITEDRLFQEKFKSCFNWFLPIFSVNISRFPLVITCMTCKILAPTLASSIWALHIDYLDRKFLVFHVSFFYAQVTNIKLHIPVQFCLLFPPVKCVYDPSYGIRFHNPTTTASADYYQSMLFKDVWISVYCVT